MSPVIRCLSLLVVLSVAPFSGCIPQIAIDRWEGPAYICNQHGDCYAPSLGPPPANDYRTPQHHKGKK